MVSGWLARFAREGLAGLDDKMRPAPRPKYGQQTDRRILALLDQPPSEGYARWTSPLIAALGDVHEQQVWRFLRAHKIDLSGRNPDARAAIPSSSWDSTWRRPRMRSSSVSTKSPRSKRRSVRRDI
jgi:transposase